MQIRIYFEDTDFSGIVYHANYLRFMERGRTNYLRLIGADHRALFEQTTEQAPGFAFVVRSMAIEVTLQPADKSFTDADLKAIADRVVAAAGKLGASLRG